MYMVTTIEEGKKGVQLDVETAKIVAKICALAGPSATLLFIAALERGGCVDLKEIDMAKSTRFSAVAKLKALGLATTENSMLCVTS